MEYDSDVEESYGTDADVRDFSDTNDSEIGYYEEDEEDDSSEIGYYEEDEEDDSLSVDSDSDDVQFSALSAGDIRGRVDEATAEISSQLSVSSHGALVLLCKFGWNASAIHEEWFSDEAKTRLSCGLLVPESSDGQKKVTSDSDQFFCGICLECYDGGVEDHRAVMSSCGHVFCKTCWGKYISTSVKDGPGCLSLRCPQLSCRASIGDMIDNLLMDEDIVRYENHILRSYVESRKNIKWCPFPGCEFVVELASRQMGQTNSNVDVTCNCSHGFCFNCSEENHTPADCSLVSEWTLKNNSESENKNWIITNTKPCPKCERLIEKNEGCMHMSCVAPCKYEFCWLCLGPWSEHGDHSGGFYSCNGYEVARKAGELSEQQKIVENAKNALKKYTHYFNRWMENHKSRMKAKESIKELSSKHLEKLSDDLMLTMNQLQFIKDAWIQIVECRRVLKWSYAYGYYLPEEETAKKALFEYLQGEAEANLEKLHDLAENQVAKLSEGEVPVDGFDGFRAKIIDLTKITRNYFDNLVAALANGLSDVRT